MEFKFSISDVATEEVMKIDRTLTAAGHEQNDEWVPSARVVGRI